MGKKFFKTIAACLLAVLSVCFLFTACDDNDKKIADNTEHFDEITKTLKLTKPFEGKELMSSDGIGEAEIPSATTDGDTTTFRLKKSGESYPVRYQGVDTPESTGGVEKWGKAASKFTNDCLTNATQIVLESASGGVPDRDSVGSRLMCYVWYRTGSEDFKLLNLELVENGYSVCKEDATKPYYSYFQKAEKFARSIELRWFSKLPDPLFDTAVQQLSLKEIYEHPESYEENTKVELTAFVTDKSASSSGAITFTIAQYDEETNKVYTFPLYAGYTASTGSMRIGDLYHIVGTLGSHSGALQIAGVTLDNDSKGDSGKTWRAQPAYYLTFDSDSSNYTKKVSANCYSDVTVGEVTLSGKTLTFKGTALKSTASATDSPTTFTFKVTVPDDYNNDITEGQTVSIRKCFQFTAGSNELTVISYSDIIK